MLFGFTYKQEKFFADGENAPDAKKNITSISNWKRERLMPMRALPVDLGSVTYNTAEGKQTKVTLKEWDGMPRSDKGYGRHEK